MVKRRVGPNRRWGGLDVVLAAFGLSLAACSETGDDSQSMSQGVIYGADDRVEVFDLPASSVGADVARFSVALVANERLDRSNPLAVQVVAPTLTERVGLCEDERFGSQPTAATCTATLITEELVVTAGHCIAPTTCESTSFVFGYQMEDPETPAVITQDQVFACSEVVARSVASGIDYAVVRLDRPVPGAELPLLKVGTLPLAPGQSVLVAGHPTGLPLKVTGGAQVSNPRPDARDYFVADLDSFPGNSGSGVFREGTRDLVGVLVRGPNPGYERLPGEDCVRPERVPAGTQGSIESVYIHHVIAGFCAVATDARLCACGDGVCSGEGGETTATCAEDCGSRCGDGECNGAETGDDCYEDCGRCGNGVCENTEIANMSCSEDCGCPPAMVPSGSSCVPALGNVNGDGVIDELDVAQLWKGLAGRGRIARAHWQVADVTCDGEVDENDADALSAFVSGTEPRLPCHSARSLALGAQHSCAVFGAGRVRCWGANEFGQLGVGNKETIGDDEPAAHAPFVALGGLVRQLAAGGSHTCALLYDGSVSCWGEGAFGRLGTGDIANVGDDEPPSTRVELGAPAVFIAAGGGHSCAILETGGLQCWGSNHFGQLGYGSPESIGDDEAPSAVAPIVFPTPVVQVALGFDHTCALTEAGRVYCWGGNFIGQLGRGTLLAGGPLERASDTAPIALGGPAREVAAGPLATCAVRDDGAVLCWGANFLGQLGYGHTNTVGDDESPEAVGPALVGSSTKSLTIGQDRTCAVDHAGGVKCWGGNSGGELGYGNTLPLLPGTVPESLPPIAIGGRAASVVAGFHHTCAILEGGGVVCWGHNGSGQLGYGHEESVGDSWTPELEGEVPTALVTSPQWRFHNPLGIQVTVKERFSPYGSWIALAVAGVDRSETTGYRAIYSFNTTELPDQVPTLVDLHTPCSTPRVEPQAPNLYSLVFDFASSHRSTRCRGESVQIHDGMRREGWDWRNDYGAAEQTGKRRWNGTTRVQIVDDTGHLIYGLTPRSN